MTRTSRRRRASLLGAGGLVLTVALAPGASSTAPVAHAAAPSRFVTGWIPYWEMDDGDGVIGVNGAPAVFADANVFAFRALGASNIPLEGGETAYAAAVKALRAKGITTFGTIVDHMGKLGMATLLADDATRAEHVQAIVGLTVQRQLDGIDIDYENFAFTDPRTSWETTRPLWVKFVNELGAAMHAQGKLLAVTVPAIWDRGTRGYTVYDWAAIIDAVDRLRIMVYDWSVPNAANAPMSWVTSVIDYTKLIVPNSIGKVQLGVPTYGYSWAKIESGTCPTNAILAKLPVQTESAAGIAAANDVTPVRDPAGSGEMTFSYTVQFTGVSNVTLTPPGYVPPAVVAPVVGEAGPNGLKPATRVMQPGVPVSCIVRRTVFYPDSASVVQRAKAALQAGMSGIAIWALGYESTDLWAQLSTIDAANPTAAFGDATLGDVNRAEVHPGGVEVVGWAFDPEVDLPVHVQVSVNGSEWSGEILARTRRDDVAQVFAGIDASHGFAVVVPTAVQPGDTVCVRALGWGRDAGPREIGCVTVTAAPSAELAGATATPTTVVAPESSVTEPAAPTAGTTTVVAPETSVTEPAAATAGTTTVVAPETSVTEPAAATAGTTTVVAPETSVTIPDAAVTPTSTPPGR